MRYFIILITAACLLGISIRSSASDLFTKIGLETRYSNGDSTYHISFDDTWENGGHGESEVEFPIANTMAGVSLGAEYVDIETRGRQHQSFYAGPYKGMTYDVHDKITSSSWSSIFRISYAF
jgi:hypothetical protein